MNPLRVVALDQCASTNDEAWRWIETHPDRLPVLIRADVQTRGRGQHGRAWVSPKKGNLLASLGFKPVVIANASWLPVLAGLAAVEALGARELSLKWPNDIYWGDAKVGGILSESRFLGEACEGIVVGLGLNVAHAPMLATAPDSAEQPRTACLVELLPIADPEAYVAHLGVRWASRLMDWLPRLEDPGSLLDDWKKWGSRDPHSSAKMR